MKNEMKRLTLPLAACCLGLAARAGVKMAQDVTLNAGWNAVYVSVTPEEEAATTFATWPVACVGRYDPASYLETKQFSGADTTDGTIGSGFAVWYRDNPALSQFDRVAGNCLYVCYATNRWSGTVFGAPVAPRTTWHPTSTTTPHNYVGLSLVPGSSTSLKKYFSGLDTGSASLQKVYRLCGSKPESVSLSLVNVTTALVTNGFVAVMSASKASDWSGVLRVSPQNGVDFSTNLTQVSLSVRNDGATNRTMRLAMTSGSAPADEDSPQVPPGLMLRDTSVYTNDWIAFSRDAPFDRLLKAGEEVTLYLALDRTQMKGIAAGTYFGGILHFIDRDGGSNFRASIPVEATCTGGDGTVGAWPMGVWIASGRFDTVTSYDKTSAGEDVAAGGNMEVRLPMYVDETGAMTLLQRFVFGSDTNGATHVYSSRTESAFPVPIVNMKRVSSAVLPIDQGRIGATAGTFGNRAEFSFTVGEKSPVNPMRHAFHPSHDGKRWDFTTETPSGDDLNNYVSTVKPESFSITNRITFTWNETTGKAWSPEETLSGSLTWELTGVRKEGPVRMNGTFGMKRISNVTIDR